MTGPRVLNCPVRVETDFDHNLSPPRVRFACALGPWKCNIIGVLEVLQIEEAKKGIRNDRLIAVPRELHRERADKDATETAAAEFPTCRGPIT